MILTKRNNTYVRIDFHSAQDGVTDIGFTHTSERMERTMVTKTCILMDISSTNTKSETQYNNP